MKGASSVNPARKLGKRPLKFLVDTNVFVAAVKLVRKVIIV